MSSILYGAVQRLFLRKRTRLVLEMSAALVLGTLRSMSGVAPLPSLTTHSSQLDTLISMSIPQMSARLSSSRGINESGNERRALISADQVTSSRQRSSSFSKMSIVYLQRRPGSDAVFSSLSVWVFSGHAGFLPQSVRQIRDRRWFISNDTTL